RLPRQRRRALRLGLVLVRDGPPLHPSGVPGREDLSPGRVRPVHRADHDRDICRPPGQAPLARGAGSGGGALAETFLRGLTEMTRILSVPLPIVGSRWTPKPNRG